MNFEDKIRDKSKIRKNKSVIKYNDVELDEIKDAFIKDYRERGYSEITVKDAINLMRKTQKYEIIGGFGNGKSFENFSKTDLVSLIRSFSSSSIRTLRTYKVFYENFFDFAIRIKARYSDNNPASEISEDELKELYIDKSDEQFITREELYTEIIPYIENPIHQFAAASVFEGIKGVACVEAVNLKQSSFNIEKKSVNFIRRYKKKEEPFTLIIKDDRYWDIYKEVVKYSLDFHVTTSLSDTEIYIDNEYIFKPFKNQTDGAMKMSNYAFNRIVKNVFSNDDVNRRYITVNTLYNSGMVERIYKEEDMLKEGEKLTFTQFAKILDEMREPVSAHAHFKIYKEVKKYLF